MVQLVPVVYDVKIEIFVLNSESLNDVKDSYLIFMSRYLSFCFFIGLEQAHGASVESTSSENKTTHIRRENSSYFDGVLGTI